jgi:hypothetical protein
MPKPSGIWQVLPHGLLTRLADTVYTVNGQLDTLLGETTRRMTVVRLVGRRLAIFGAIALREEEMEKLEALGKPTFLIAPAGTRRLDVDAWLTRYPRLQLVDPPEARSKLGDVAGWSGDLHELDLGDPRVSLTLVPGTRGHEFALLVKSSSGKSLVLNELIFNLPRARGYRATLMQLAGLGPAPTIPPLVRLTRVRDKAALRDQLIAWAKLPGLERIVPCHGEPIERPREVLLQLARTLGSQGLPPVPAPTLSSPAAQRQEALSLVPSLQEYARRRAS